MPKALKIILILLLFIGFFEAGLLSSYTIITSEAPDVKGLIDLQIDTIAGIFSSENINNVIIKYPSQVNITNKMELSDDLAPLVKVDGVDIDSINVTTYENPEGKFQVNITAACYSSPNTTKGQIVLSGTPDYRVIATANATSTSSGIEIDTSTIKIISIMKLFTQNKN